MDYCLTLIFLIQLIFLEFYIKVVLNSKEKPSIALSEAFRPLFTLIGHEDFKTLLVPASLKMLKRNPELVMESIADLLESVNLDLSKYAIEFISILLPQARHADEERRVKALTVIGCLSQKSSDPDAVSAIFNAIKAILGGQVILSRVLKKP